MAADEIHSLSTAIFKLVKLRKKGAEKSHSPGLFLFMRQTPPEETLL